MKFDIPVNFTVEAKDEKTAIEELMWFIKTAVFTIGKEDEIVDYELFEFIPEHSVEADAEPSCGRCGNNDCC